MLPPNFKIEFIQGYQDKKIQYDSVPITGKLNVETKKYSTKYTSIPKNTHIIFTPMSIYINNIYIPTHIYCAIRMHSHATEAKTVFFVRSINGLRLLLIPSSGNKTPSPS